jgi:molybdate transport system ATP-binding protein
MSALRAEIRHEFERLALHVDLDLDGGLTALLGPSGAGKTSVLNVLAGLLRPDFARVEIAGATVADTTRGLWTPSHRRRIGYVFQESRLFSHLTVRQNLAFGRWFAGRRDGGIGIDDVVDLLGLGGLLHRHPARLSGGEQRRVALGRALLSHPRLLLLDEPLGSLDVARRQEILPYLDRLIAELRLPMIYVTHDWNEIHGRAQQVVWMDHGTSRTSAAGAPATTPGGSMR